MSDVAVYHTLPTYEQRNMPMTNGGVFSTPRNPNLAKWNILFDKKPGEWLSFKPQLGLHAYPCYSCRDMFGSKNSFLDHVNRRGMILKFKCSFCARSDELIFYNPCSFLLHTRQHYTLGSGQINLENLQISVLPFGLVGFLPDPNVPLLYNVEDDNIGETLFINTRFYSPSPESMGQPIINLVAHELLFFYSSEPNTASLSLVLKQISSNIPHCQFVTLDSNRLAAIPSGLDINGKELQSGENNINGFRIKEEPPEPEVQNYSVPVIVKTETLADEANEPSIQQTNSTVPLAQNTTKYPSCPECGEVQTVPMGEHFLKTNNPFQESLKCSICKYIAPTKCSLQAHERIHESIAPYVCPECGKDFEDWKLLHAHLEEVCFHLTKQVRMRCPGKKCGKIFAQVITFSSHFIAHMPCYSRCTICNLIFSNDIDYLDHTEIHDAKLLPSKVYKCSVCKDSTEIFTENNLHGHIHEHATNKKQCLYVYICKHCHSYFRSTATYATHLLRCSKLASHANSNTQLKRKSNTVQQVIGTCTACNLQIRSQVHHSDNAQIYCPVCNELVTFPNVAKKNTDTDILFSSVWENDSSSKEMPSTKSYLPVKKVSCLLCQQKLTLSEMDNHFTLKKCRYCNPVVVLDSKVENSTFTINSIKQEVDSDDSSKQPENFSVTPDDCFKRTEGSPPKSDDSSKRSEKSDDSSKKKRKKSIGTPFSNKYSKLSTSNSETDINLEPEEPVPFDGTYYCKLCDYSNTIREHFHEHIVKHRDVCTAYQCMECGECFVVKPSLAKHLLYYHQVSDIETYFNENDCFDKKAVKELEETMRLAPGESKDPVAENQCRVCLLQFNDALELSKHFRIHGMAFLLKNSK